MKKTYFTYAFALMIGLTTTSAFCMKDEILNNPTTQTPFVQRKIALLRGELKELEGRARDAKKTLEESIKGMPTPPTLANPDDSSLAQSGYKLYENIIFTDSGDSLKQSLNPEQYTSFVQAGTSLLMIWKEEEKTKARLAELEGQR